MKRSPKPLIEYIRGDGSTIADLVARSGYTRETILKHVKTLEEQGFIERVYRISGGWYERVPLEDQNPGCH